MNPIFTFFKFLYDDTKADLITLKRMFTEKGFVEAGCNRIGDSLKQFSFYNFLERNWMNMIILAAFFFAGWFIAAKYYEGMANQAIINAQMQVLIPKNFSQRLIY